jgi:hypothetical protein
MPFSNFKSIADVQQRYNIVEHRQPLIQATPVQPSAAFLELYEFDVVNVDTASEAARQETLIYPILREIFRHHTERLSLFSHRALSMNGDPDLTGTPDYLVSQRSPLGRSVIGKPLMVIIEAKQDDFTGGWGQCLAELVAVQRYNDDEETPVFGIVTNGDTWEFGLLRQADFILDPAPFTVRNLPELLGALDFAFRQGELADESPLSPSGERDGICTRNR